LFLEIHVDAFENAESEKIRKGGKIQFEAAFINYRFAGISANFSRYYFAF
jgi:hypothetical protein